MSACDVFDAELERRIAPVGATAECRVHSDCGGTPAQPIACVQPAGRCVPLLSEDCREVIGSLASPDALVIGSLFSLTGSQGNTNLPRQRSAAMAVEQINAYGGVPGPDARRRPLVMVSCDEAADLLRAGRHLIESLAVPAIVGPNTSQDTIDLTNQLSAARGTLLLSPTAVASSIADLNDDDLTWVMVPSDEQRAPLMAHQIGELEQQLRTERGGRPIKLSVIFRNDALGTGTRTGLNSLILNGKTLLDNQSGSPTYAVIERYDPSVADQSALVARQRAFAPDIVVIAGLAEAITNIMLPLEQAWVGEERPYYVSIDSLKVPELLQAASMDESLRLRVRGTGIVPTERSASVYEAFRLDFQTRFPDVPSTISGMGPAYDATLALAYALAATRDTPVSGASIAAGLRKLSGGAVETELRSTKILAAFHELAQGKPIEAIGTFAPLRWNARGAPLGGRVEIWCIGRGPSPSYQSSTLTYDLATQTVSGRYQQCDAQ